jgi:hypothetical protein
MVDFMEFANFALRVWSLHDCPCGSVVEVQRNFCLVLWYEEVYIRTIAADILMFHVDTQSQNFQNFFFCGPNVSLGSYISYASEIA